MSNPNLESILESVCNIDNDYVFDEQIQQLLGPSDRDLETDSTVKLQFTSVSSSSSTSQSRELNHLALPADNKRIKLEEVSDHVTGSNPHQKIKPISSAAQSERVATIHDSAHNSELFATLLDVPNQLLHSFNVGDLDNISRIFNLYFTEDCGVTSPTLPGEMRGREYAFGMYRGFQATFPDSMFVLKSTKFIPSVNVNVVELYTSGTKLFSGPDDSLYDPFLYDEKTTATGEGSTSKKPNEELVQQARDIMRAGKHFRTLVKVRWIFVLNPERTSIIKFKLCYKILQVKSVDDSLGED